MKEFGTHQVDPLDLVLPPIDDLSVAQAFKRADTERLASFIYMYASMISGSSKNRDFTVSEKVLEKAQQVRVIKDGDTLNAVLQEAPIYWLEIARTGKEGQVTSGVGILLDQEMTPIIFIDTHIKSNRIIVADCKKFCYQLAEYLLDIKLFSIPEKIILVKNAAGLVSIIAFLWQYLPTLQNLLHHTPELSNQHLAYLVAVVTAVSGALFFLTIEYRELLKAGDREDLFDRIRQKKD